MRLLLDTCVWGGAKAQLQNEGHDVLWIGDESADPGDDEILKRAWVERRILVTLDKDFGELAIVHGTAHAGIVRLVNIAARTQAASLNRVLAVYGLELTTGAIVTVEPTRVRIRAREAPSG